MTAHAPVTATHSSRLTVGTRVRIERDESRYPSRGTWPQFRGKTGTLLEINRAGRGATEYGIGFGAARRTDAWFKAYELTRLNPEDSTQ